MGTIIGIIIFSHALHIHKILQYKFPKYFTKISVIDKNYMAEFKEHL